MPPKKNQHYVPKLCLKSFSIKNEGSQIGLFNLTNDFFRKEVALKHQAKEDYFYGEDGELEEELSKLESIAAPVLKTIINTNSIPPKSSPDYLKVLTFSMILASRTKDVTEQMNEWTNKFINEMMKHDEDMKDKADKYIIQLRNPAALAVSTAAKAIHLALDLRLKLLVNKSKTKFLMSDHPIIRYNQFLEQRKHPGGNVGIATKGLQVFFPISPSHMLCFYDDWVYKFGARSQEVIEITNIKDIDTLNYLQVLNCLDHLYFNEEITERYVRELYLKAKSKRLREYSTLQKGQNYIDKEGLEHIPFHSYNNNIEIGLELSFITQTKKAKQHVLSDYAVQLRDESLRTRRS